VKFQACEVKNPQIHCGQYAKPYNNQSDIFEEIKPLTCTVVAIVAAKSILIGTLFAWRRLVEVAASPTQLRQEQSLARNGCANAQPTKNNL